LMVGVGYLLNDVPTAVRVCRELEELDIYLFETPFPVDSPEPYEPDGLLKRPSLWPGANIVSPAGNSSR